MLMGLGELCVQYLYLRNGGTPTVGVAKWCCVWSCLPVDFPPTGLQSAALLLAFAQPNSKTELLMLSRERQGGAFPLYRRLTHHELANEIRPASVNIQRAKPGHRSDQPIAGSGFQRAVREAHETPSVMTD